MRVLSIHGSTSRVSLGGVTKDVSTVLLPTARVGGYVIVHAGFAIESVDEEAAARTIEYMRQLAAATEEEDGSHA
jgi:hydrogenase expression/formation protein HypC